MYSVVVPSGGGSPAIEAVEKVNVNVQSVVCCRNGSKDEVVMEGQI